MNSETPPKFEFENLSQCPLCDHRSFEVRFERRIRGVPLKFVTCDQCGLTYQNPRMTRDSLRKYFGSNYFIQDSKMEGSNFDQLLGYYDYSSWEKSYRKTADIRLAAILKYKQPGASLLEIGSATGFFLEAARGIGFEARGLDASKKFAETARKKGFNIDEGFIETYPLPPHTYDIICCFGGITCWHDPVAGLRNIYKTLKKNGIFSLNFMDADNFFYKIQGARNYDYQHACLILWSEITMRDCLKKAGFNVLLCQSEKQYVSLGRLFEYLKLPLAHKTVRALRMSELSLPAIVPFTKFAVCKPTYEN